jgi:hypothetical protein
MGFFIDYLTYVGVITLLAFIRFLWFYLTTEVDKYGKKPIKEADAP